MVHDERLPLTSLAAQAAVVERCLDGGELPRFRRLCKSSEGIRARLAFGVGDEGGIAINGTLGATVVVDCQRCLDAIAVELRSEFSVVAVANEADAVRLAHRSDLLEVESLEPTLAEVIEDELILMLPMRPCERRDCDRAPALAYPPEARYKRNPFESLAAFTED